MYWQSQMNATEPVEARAKIAAGCQIRSQTIVCVMSGVSPPPYKNRGGDTGKRTERGCANALRETNVLQTVPEMDKWHEHEGMKHPKA